VRRRGLWRGRCSRLPSKVQVYGLLVGEQAGDGLNHVAHVLAAAEATARRSGGRLPALVVEVAAGGQASGSTSGCVNRMGLPSDRA
jgi:hypothetical protein